MSSFSRALILVRWSAIFVFLGRAYQHIFWEAPYRNLIWNEPLLRPFIESSTPFTWEYWVSSEVLDAWIHTISQGVGFFYLFAAYVAFRVTRERTFEQTILGLGAFLLVLLALIFYQDKSYQVGQFFEYSCQFGAPLVLIWMTGIDRNDCASLGYLRWVIKVLVVLTFASHGLYAVGFYPVPGEFQEMTMNLLRVDDPGAFLFLKIVGILDFVLAILAWRGSLAKWALAYSTLWGLATALARVMAFVSWPNFSADLHQWGFETIVRLPHALIPAACLFILLRIESFQRETVASIQMSPVFNPVF